jgi:hypothetical protein
LFTGHKDHNRRRRLANPPNRFEKCARLDGCHRIHHSVEVVDHDDASMKVELSRTRHPRRGMTID